ncbi:hypothetical protein TRFO_04660 [Tritrichomonas foetus]|uniref:Ubiquitin-like domain-containing protein n=1 Tax=Tritrichomonas foetus TaxID=1144522 RepID=A0A1J4KCD0_9EUKA|nr:hypothetical protein TRFO_04660 [Tritrichomonas foetus]|eukprot:OHT09081.1 hypothetical protein TRFO_04660 [Tritrichomonas foetus]
MKGRSIAVILFLPFQKGRMVLANKDQEINVLEKVIPFAGHEKILYFYNRTMLDPNMTFEQCGIRNLESILATTNINNTGIIQRILNISEKRKVLFKKSNEIDHLRSLRMEKMELKNSKKCLRQMYLLKQFEDYFSSTQGQGSSGNCCVDYETPQQPSEEPLPAFF